MIAYARDKKQIDHVRFHAGRRVVPGARKGSGDRHESHDPPTALDALDAAFTELNQVDRLLSIYRTDSQVCRLNRNGFLDAPHPCLLEALRVARRVAQ